MRRARLSGVWHSVISGNWAGLARNGAGNHDNKLVGFMAKSWPS